MVEQFQRLLDLLDDETLRQIALWRLQGNTTDEIACRLGCARRTVANRLRLIRERWRAEVPT
jgi:DNA-directed RNA polymerase specialized sigma24 family protein